LVGRLEFNVPFQHKYANIIDDKCFQCFETVGWASGRASGR